MLSSFTGLIIYRIKYSTFFIKYKDQVQQNSITVQLTQICRTWAK